MRTTNPTKCIEVRLFATRYFATAFLALACVMVARGSAATDRSHENAITVAESSPPTCDDEYTKSLGAHILRLLLLLGGYPIPTESNLNAAMDYTTSLYAQSGIPADLSASELDALSSAAAQADAMLSPIPACLDLTIATKFRETLASIQGDIAAP